VAARPRERLGAGQAFMLGKGTGTVFPAAVLAAAPNSPSSKWRDGAGPPVAVVFKHGHSSAVQDFN
jgi:hypothetical protein